MAILQAHQCHSHNSHNPQVHHYIMYPNSDNNATAAADAASMPGGDISLYARKSVDHRQMAWSPVQPPQHYHYPPGQQHFQSPPRGYYNQPIYSSYSTPREQSEPPTSPPRLRQSDGNLSMMSSVEEASSPVMDAPSNRKMMLLTAAASKTEEGSIIAERRTEEVVDGRAQNDDFMSRVASPTPNLPLKKRKAISKESVLSMEIDKLKADLGRAEMKIKSLEEENERLRQQQQPRDTSRSSFDKGHLPFIPDLPGNNTASPGKGAINQVSQHEKHHNMLKQQQLHSIYRVPSSSGDQKLPIPQENPFIQSHHGDIGRPVYHPYPTTPPNSGNHFEHHHHHQQRSQHIHRDRRDSWVRPPTNNHVDSSSATSTPETHKKISFALSFDANTKNDVSRGYNRCVSNRGRGSRPPLASRWKSR